MWTQHEGAVLYKVFSSPTLALEPKLGGMPYPFPKAMRGDELGLGFWLMSSWKAEFRLSYVYEPVASASTTQLG